ncbi:MAG TPA: PDR/VanB family oxidoreductase [Actinomycetales bacterium]
MTATAAGRWSTCTVADVADVADGVRAVTLQRPPGGPAGHPVAAGAHVDVLVPVQGRDEVRSYSVVDADVATGRLRIAVRLAGSGAGGSAYVHTLEPGDRIRVSAAVQSFPLTRGRPGYVLVAAGIGITALLPMLRELTAAGADVRLVYVGRRRSAMAFLDELEAGHPCQVEAVVGDEGGRLEVRELVQQVPAGHELYVCGPVRLLDALRAAWAEAGRDPQRLRFETFGGGGRHLPQAFEVEVPAQGLRVSVPVGTSLLDALRGAGAEMMFDCRRGECGVCEVRVLACEGEIDHGDVFLSPEQRARGRTLCSCVWRAVAADAGTPALLTLQLP